MLNYLPSHHKMNLPSILFQYLKETIKFTRIGVIQSKKAKNHIPFGHLLSDIFIENDLVEFLNSEGKHAEDLVQSIGEFYNIKILKHMTMVTQYKVDPHSPPSDLAQRRIHVTNYPSLCKKDSLVCGFNGESISLYTSCKSGSSSCCIKSFKTL